MKIKVNWMALAVISQTTQAADNKGEDTNAPVQVNPVTTKP